MSARPLLELWPKGGLGNRLSSLLTGLMLADAAGAELQVKWTNDSSLWRGRWSDLFETAPEGMEIFESDAEVACPTLASQADVQAAIERLKRGENVAVWCLSLHLPFNYAWERFHQLRKQLGRSLVPNAEVRRQMYAPAPFDIGVHIRRTDQLRAIRWSPSHLFVKAMQERSRAHPDARFFLATDDHQVSERMRGLFGSNLVELDSNPVQRSGAADSQHACAVMLTLARCGSLLASHASSFTRITTLLWDVPETVLRLEGSPAKWHGDLISTLAEKTHKYCHERRCFIPNTETGVPWRLLAPFVGQQIKRLASDAYQWGKPAPGR